MPAGPWSHEGRTSRRERFHLHSNELDGHVKPRGRSESPRQPAVGPTGALLQADGRLLLVPLKPVLVFTVLGCGAAPLGRHRLASEQLRSPLTEAHLTEEDEDVPPERLGEDGVEERVGAGVERVEEHQQNLGVGDGDERPVQRGRHGVEGDGRHAQEVGEDEHGHALGDVGVLGPGAVVRVVHCAVDLEVASADNQKGQDVEHQHGQDEDLRPGGLRVHRQTDADLLVAAHADQRQQGQQEAERPAAQHHGRRVLQAQLTVQPHGEGDGVPALQSDHRQGVDRQLAGEDREEPGEPAAGARLPVDGVVEVLGSRVQVHGGDEQQVDPHAQVGKGQVAHEEAGHRELVVAGEQHQEHRHVPQNRQQTHEPHGHSQEAKPHYVLAGIELIRHRCTRHLLPLLTHHIIVATVKVLAGVLLGVLEGLSKTHILIWLAPKIGVVVEASMQVTSPPVAGLFVASVVWVLVRDRLLPPVALEGRRAEEPDRALVMLVVERRQVTDEVLQEAATHEQTGCPSDAAVGDGSHSVRTRRPHILTSSPPHLLTSSRPHSLTSSPPHVLTASHPHLLTSSHPHILTSSHPHLLTSSHPHILTSSHPHILTSSPPHILTSSHPHILTASHPHILSLTSSHPHILTSSQPHLLTSSHPHPHILTSSPPHILTSSQPHILTSSHPHILTSSQPHILTSSHPHSLTSSPPHILTASPPHILTSSPPHILTASPPHLLTSSHPHILTSSHPHSLTSSRPHSLTSSHPHILTSSQVHLRRAARNGSGNCSNQS
ncbi:hypothetical protein EYF80_028436 [Liparis tanakae]|uniref:Uncharacterized protein n=1 Tax=Liparis tanakae TaxID=230148 RepID=A0A4Z2H6K9_9TELE|nr:hypothetical protein EYF80_028436 [Liparis tanakae]